MEWKNTALHQKRINQWELEMFVRSMFPSTSHKATISCSIFGRQCRFHLTLDAKLSHSFPVKLLFGQWISRSSISALCLKLSQLLHIIPRGLHRETNIFQMSPRILQIHTTIFDKVCDRDGDIAADAVGGDDQYPSAFETSLLQEFTSVPYERQHILSIFIKRQPQIFSIWTIIIDGIKVHVTVDVGSDLHFSMNFSIVRFGSGSDVQKIRYDFQRIGRVGF